MAEIGVPVKYSTTTKLGGSLDGNTFSHLCSICEGEMSVVLSMDSKITWHGRIKGTRHIIIFACKKHDREVSTVRFHTIVSESEKPKVESAPMLSFKLSDDTIGDDDDFLTLLSSRKPLATKGQTKTLKASQRKENPKSQPIAFIDFFQEPSRSTKFFGGIDDSHIESLLSKYEEGEEDSKSLGINSAEQDEEFDEEITVLFLDTLSRSPLQCIRYMFDGNPLFAVKPEPIHIPNCPNCGSIRVFDFQTMPNLTALLQWGSWTTILIYVCKADCISSDPMNEYQIIQSID